jgi:hypothetical protein
LLADSGYAVNPVATTAVIGGLAIVLATVSAFYGMAFTIVHEMRTEPEYLPKQGLRKPRLIRQ